MREGDVMDGLLPLLGDWTAESILGFVILLIILDKLRPAKRADRELGVLREQIEDKKDEAERWRVAFFAQQEINRTHAAANVEAVDQAKRMADGQETIVRLVTASLPRQGST